MSLPFTMPYSHISRLVERVMRRAEKAKRL
jgi:hypothetical protein